MKIIAVVNQKGGVGKTTTSLNLAVGLAKKGNKVLAIDFDPQSSLTLSLGHERKEKEITLLELIENSLNSDMINIEESIFKHKEGIDYIPSDIRLSSLELTLINAMSRETVLKCLLEQFQLNYDYCIIDCGPSLGLLTINALTAANEIIIPVKPDYLSLMGMDLVLNTISKVVKINNNLKISGILLTLVDTRKKMHKEMIGLIKETYDGKIKIFNSIIPQSVKVEESPIEGKSIYEYSSKNKVAESYSLFVNEIVGGN